MRIKIICITILNCIFIYQITFSEENIDLDTLNKKLFTQIYQENVWGNPQTASGGGSTLSHTTTLRMILPILFKTLKIKTFLDAPCGDFYWMKETDLSFLDLYIGIDIVDEMIKNNTLKYADQKRIFITLDIVNDPLPQVDIILCRDCLQHLPNKQVFKVINNFKKSKSTYLLVSNHPKLNSCSDIESKDLTNAGRTIYRNLHLPPFNFPEPLVSINEGFEEKVLMLFKLEDLLSYNS